MDKNKSIDGLVVRRAKKPATTIHNVKKPESNTPKYTTRQSTNIQKKINIAESKPKSEAQPKTAQTTTEDFLKPVQVFDFDEQSGELTSSKKLVEKPKKKKEKKPMSKKRKIIIGIILAVITILIGVVIWFIIWGCDILSKITDGQGSVFDLFTETYEPLQTDANGRTNILAFGTSGYDMDGTEGDGTHDGAQLTDSIMVISLNQETGDIAMVSLPRDLKASPTCTATGKINEVYWCNNQDGTDEQSGATALMTEVGDILGIDFQYYVHLNWGSLVQIIDILGGVNITLDEDIEDYYYTGAVYQAGVEYILNGEEALGLARARHGTTSGDFSRGASQQKILIGIKDKVVQNNLSLTDLISLASTLGDNIRTNFSVEELKTCAHILTDLDLNSMRQISLLEPEKLMTTNTINGISYVLPSAGVGNYDNIQLYVAKMFSNDPRVYEDASILILNGTDIPGLASIEQTTLEKEGYKNIYIDDAPANSTESYTIYALTDTAPKTKTLLEQKYNTTAKTAEELPDGISTTCDFIIVLGSTQTESE
jgi:polyisoprenyl-teichoic acid--peptidoglycan teichoic acid transferase